MSLTNQEAFDRLKKVRDETLNAVSPSFCLAKWTQSTIYLFNGQTHSCHHPGTHRINVGDIQRNPSGLHNTPEKQKRRQEMLDGKYPVECDYCWRIEKRGQEHLSDRAYKSAASWSLPRLQEVLESKTGPDFRPSYIEIAFDSTCNFKCVYCMPHISSRWWEEIEQHGPYLLQGDKYNDLDYIRRTLRKPIRHDEYNPYIEAFWKIWPEWYETLHTFRITGGEPLLSKHTWKIFDWVEEHPNPNITLSLNTNLSVPDKLIDELVRRAPAIQANVKNFTVFTSLESTGAQAEYARFGMDYIKFMLNCRKVLQAVPRIDFMTTVNLLSAATFVNFMQRVLDLRREFNDRPGANRIGVMVNIMRYPEFLDIRLLPSQLKMQLTSDIERLIETSEYNVHTPSNTGILYIEEVDQLRRLIHCLKEDAPQAEKQIDKLRDFASEMDRRRGTSFIHTFPELFGLLNSPRIFMSTPSTMQGASHDG